jgi:cardiolipin synthase
MCAVFVVFFERKNPGVIWAWLLVLGFLPICGFIIYFIFGFEGRRHIIFAKKADADKELFEKIKSELDYAETKSDNGIVALNENSAESRLYSENSVKIFNEGTEKFENLINDIRSAKKHIHIQYYIFKSDRLGSFIIDELAKKSKEGVEVRLLYDGIGNSFNRKGFCDELLNSGGMVAMFQPPKGLRINYRNHRKIAVIDGCIGYVGGINVGDEYIGKSKKFGFWRDSHIRIEGDAVYELQMRFIADWNVSEALKGSYYRPIENTKPYFPVIDKIDNKKMQIVSSGPDCSRNSIQYGYIKMINNAKKNIYLTTPYFVPDESILESLKIAALSGVDVRIIFPAKPDHPFVYWCSLDYVGELLYSGVRCFEYTKGFTHAKLITTDGKVSSIGTANMDIRSFKLNFEINAFIYDGEITQEFEKQFEEDFNFSNEITVESYEKRSAVVRVKEAFARLISPLL